MNEEPKSIWKRNFTGRTAVLVWALLAGLAIALAIFIVALFNIDRPWGQNLMGAMFCAIIGIVLIALAIYVVWPLARLLFWKHWRRTLFGLACFATLIALFYAEENWRGRRAWENFKREWEAKGEQFDFKSFVPPRVPDEQNFALTPVIASCYEMFFDTSGHELKPRRTNVVNRLSMVTWESFNKGDKIPESPGWLAEEKMDLPAWQRYFRFPPPTNSLITNSFPVAPQLQTPAEDVLLALSKYDSTIEEIRQASRLPESRFPLTYDTAEKFGILLPHLAALKICAQTLRLRSVAELEMSRTESACADVKLEFCLANSIRTEPFIISQLVRLSILETTLQPVWEGLAEHRWSATQLIALDAELTRLDFLADCQRAQKAEMGFMTDEIMYLRRQSDFDARFGQMGISFSADAINEFRLHRLTPSGWFFQSAVRNCAVLMRYLPAVDREARTLSPRLVRQADEFATAQARIFDPMNSFKKLFDNDALLSEGNFLKKTAASQTYLDLARTAIALERYRLAHGNFPESLDVLAPPFLEKIPHDVIGGQPLKYRRTADGQFILYSVGWNETDDGGAVVFKKDSLTEIDRDKGDWVWRYPAK